MHEHPIAEESVIALSVEGLFQSPHSNIASTNQNRIDIEEALVTGAIAAMDIDGDDVIGGLALSVLDQLTRRDETPVQQLTQTWTIAEATPLKVYTTAPVALPIAESVTAKATLLESVEAPQSLIGFGNAPTSLIKMVLRPEESKTIDFHRRGERIVSATLEDEEMVSLSFDQPLESGQTALLHTALKPSASAETTNLDVVTVSANGIRQWHRFELHRG